MKLDKIDRKILEFFDQPSSPLTSAKGIRRWLKEQGIEATLIDCISRLHVLMEAGYLTAHALYERAKPKETAEDGKENSRTEG